MPEKSDLWAEWVREVKTELKDRHDENIQQRIDFECLRTKVETRNKIIWTLVGFLFLASGTIIALISLIKK